MLQTLLAWAPQAVFSRMASLGPWAAGGHAVPGATCPHCSRGGAQGVCSASTLTDGSGRLACFSEHCYPKLGLPCKARACLPCGLEPRLR